MAKVETDLHISKRLQALLPPLTDDEKWQLKENLIGDGRKYEPIFWWYDGEKNVIVDGMHSWHIIKANNLPYSTEQMKFADYDEAELWILNHQLGRRNLLTPEAQRKLVGDLYNRMKKPHGDEERFPGGNYCPQGEKTAEILAKQVGVSPRTVKNDGVFAEVLDRIPKSIREAVVTGKLNAGNAELKRLANADESSQQAVARDIRVGKSKSLKEAMKANKIVAKPKQTEDDDPLDADDLIEEDPTPDELVKQHNQQIESYCQRVKKLAEECPDLYWLTDGDRRRFFLTKVKNGYETLRAGKCMVCPSCNGEGCKACKKQGMAPKQHLSSQGLV
jgi:hypothetical protein